jgi:translation elongation factor EF-1alpha
VLQKDEKYVILPQDCQCIVKDIMIGNDKVKEAVVGDNVEIQIKLIVEGYL